MKTQGMDIQAASDHIGNHYKMLVDEFINGTAQLPSFGPDVDPDVARYIDAIQHWPIGNLVWSFETPRYFGAARKQIQSTRVVHLKPREEEEEK
jgi:hypothetical protein